MKENIVKFTNEVKANPEFLEKLKALGETPDPDKLISVASEYGIKLSEEDFEDDDTEELFAEDLENVSGGYGQKKKCKYCGKKISGGTLGMALHQLIEHAFS
ncbi:MAG: Nif11-like leader peptide family RiPP precursor [Butyrivibrio sp.]|nr:Nif11-like leader peptide family RiPP precursor [Butyrivibrio sp.]